MLLDVVVDCADADTVAGWRLQWNDLDAVAGRFGGRCCCWIIRTITLFLLSDVVVVASSKNS